MAVKNPQFEINIRKNTNANNPGVRQVLPEGSREADDLAARPMQPHGRAQLDLRPRHHPGRAHEDVKLYQRVALAG